MKDCLRSAQSRPCTTTFSLRRFLAPALTFFLQKWLLVAAALAFATACNAGYIDYNPVDKWIDVDFLHHQDAYGSCLQDSPEETCQCRLKVLDRENPSFRHILVNFTMDPNVGIWFPGQPSGVCRNKTERISDSFVAAENYTTKVSKIKYCFKGGDLLRRTDGMLRCRLSVESGLSLSFTRVASQSEKNDGKVPLVARVKDVNGERVVYQDIVFRLSLPGKLSRPSDPSPINYITTDENGEAFLEYTPGQTGGKTQVITGTCNPSGVCLAPVELKIGPTPVIGFFNGVWNTEKQARDGVTALEELIGSTYQGTELRYENFYNQTGTGNGNSALQDIAEVFIQRSKELDGVLDNRWEHYWELLTGKHASGDSFTSRLLSGLVNGGTALANLFDATFNAMLGQMFSGYSQMLSNPPTAADVASQLQKLRSLADEDHSFALIAHSQGNLFVNSAYDGLRSSHPDAKATVVHVAPASPTLRGEHLLADIDLVINGLRVQGIKSVASNNINLPISKSDLSGHTLVGTYLDATRAAREKINGMVQTVLGSL